MVYGDLKQYSPSRRPTNSSNLERPNLHLGLVRYRDHEHLDEPLPFYPRPLPAPSPTNCGGTLSNLTIYPPLGHPNPNNLTQPDSHPTYEFLSERLQFCQKSDGGDLHPRARPLSRKLSLPRELHTNLPNVGTTSHYEGDIIRPLFPVSSRLHHIRNAARKHRTGTQCLLDSDTEKHIEATTRSRVDILRGSWHTPAGGDPFTPSV